MRKFLVAMRKFSGDGFLKMSQKQYSKMIGPSNKFERSNVYLLNILEKASNSLVSQPGLNLVRGNYPSIVFSRAIKLQKGD
jgi:hypothetical protein